jgi:hypothetical protein
VIADLADRNPNVYYELGLAHMCKPVEKVVLLSQEIDAIPFDLRAFRHIEYQQSETGRATLIRELRQAVSSICAPVYRLPIVDSAA